MSIGVDNKLFSILSLGQHNTGKVEVDSSAYAALEKKLHQLDYNYIINISFIVIVVLPGTHAHTFYIINFSLNAKISVISPVLRYFYISYSVNGINNKPQLHTSRSLMINYLILFNIVSIL